MHCIVALAPLCLVERGSNAFCLRKSGFYRGLDGGIYNVFYDPADSRALGLEL